MKYCRLQRLSIRWLNNVCTCIVSRRDVRQAGFSLTELLVVIAIIAVLATLTGMNTSLFNRVLVRAEMEKLCTMCQYARHLAMATNTVQKIHINTTQHSYTLNEHTEILAPCVRFGYMPDVHGPPAHPQLPLYKPVTFQHDNITFYPDGIIEAGTIYLVDTNYHSMYALSNAVSQVSYLRKYRYNRTWERI